MTLSRSLHGLEAGAQLALHAMRRAAGSSVFRCPVTAERLESARAAMRTLAEMLLARGRSLRLGDLGDLMPSPDERTLLNALAAAQCDDEAALVAALRWLAGCEPNLEMMQITKVAALSFAQAGWTWETTQAPRTPEPPFGISPVRAVI
ncbi:hypothetical protein [Candidatus Phycosocius spiralis]|uniref:Uncharacterized protein n=1 Tax=Candidatus Phycosocius spiralis TaxID=2815099 RepID=A0ABQ4PWB3_9PROT|nr:hypothetical protein [Candidatus Phycosocius spiralis]GIU66963.1 hypothetical protein PsB1_1117 [Candidatus Phycosocius spiralis]